MHFKIKIVTRDKGHYIIIKTEIHQEDIEIINTYAPNNRTSKRKRQKITVEGRKIILQQYLENLLLYF